MMGAVRKMATVLVFALVITTASAGRASMLPTSLSTPGDSSVRTGSVIGCTPKKLARDIAIYCRQPVNAPMPIEACCGVAIGTVGRPSCYCLVKQEPAFGMSPLLNITNMAQLLARCGATDYLNQFLNNPCDGSYKEKKTSEQMTPKPYTCKIMKVSAYTAWFVVAVLAGVIALLVFWPPVPANQPQLQVEMPNLGQNLNDDQGSGASDGGSVASNHDSSHESSEDGEDLSDGSENLMIEGPRIRNPNPRYIGETWVR